MRTFQGIFSLPKNGVVDYATWYKISDVYVGVTRIAELRGATNRIFVPPVAPRKDNDIKIPSFYY